MIFSQFPVPAQTLADVAEAEVQFIEVVRRFHPLECERPVKCNPPGLFQPDRLSEFNLHP